MNYQNGYREDNDHFRKESYNFRQFFEYADKNPKKFEMMVEKQRKGPIYRDMQPR